MLPQTTDCEITTAVQHRKTKQNKKYKIIVQYVVCMVWCQKQKKPCPELSTFLPICLGEWVGPPKIVSCPEED